MEDQEMLRGLDGKSPFTLFLILILLILGTESEIDTTFENARNFILETKRSMENIRVGLESMHTNVSSFHAHLMDIQKK